MNCDWAPEFRAFRVKGSEGVLETSKGTLAVRWVINCAGLHSDRVAKLAVPSPVRASCRVCVVYLPHGGDMSIKLEPGANIQPLGAPPAPDNQSVAAHKAPDFLVPICGIA